MAIGFVLACIKGEGLHPPSLPLLESRRPKGHQHAQRSDIAAVMIQRETLPSGGPRLLFLQRTRELQRCGSDAVAAVRPQNAAVRSRVACTRRSLKGSYLLLLAPIVWRSSRASRAQS